MPDEKLSQSSPAGGDTAVTQQPTLADVMSKVDALEGLYQEFGTRLDAFEAPAGGAGDGAGGNPPADGDTFNGEELERSSPAFKAYMAKHRKANFEEVMAAIDKREHDAKTEKAKNEFAAHPEFSADLARKMAAVINSKKLGRLDPMDSIELAYMATTGKPFKPSASSANDLKAKLNDGVRGNDSGKGKPSIFERIKNSNGSISPEMEKELAQAIEDGSLNKEIVDKYGQDL